MTIARVYATLAMSLALAATGRAATPVVPRPAREFVFKESSGRQTPLTVFRGKVVVIEFLFTKCEDCRALSRMLTELLAELGQQRLQVVGVAFDNATAENLASYVSESGAGFPVASASRGEVMSMLGLSGTELMTVPQVMIVDAQGIVRVQSELREDLRFADAATLRAMLVDLLASLPAVPLPTGIDTPPSGPPNHPGNLPGLPPAAPLPNVPAIPPPDLPFPGQERIVISTQQNRSSGADLGAMVDGPPEGPPTLSSIRAGGPAAKAGLRVGDMVLSIQGTPLSKLGDFVSVIRRFKPGDRVEVVVIRGGRSLILTATLDGGLAR